MARVRGIGGIFFKSPDPKALRDWYARHLGIISDGDSGAMFPWDQPENPVAQDFTVWSVFPASTKYFDPSTAPFMINYVVDDLDALLSTLRDEGVEIDPKVDRSEYGNFGWIRDPDGNRIELWEPLPKKPSS